MVAAATMNAAVLVRTGKATMAFNPKAFLLEFDESKHAKPASVAKESAPRKSWQHMKFIGQQMAAIANAEEKAKVNKANKRKR